MALLNGGVRKEVGEPTAAMPGFREADIMQGINHRLLAGLPLGELTHSLGFHDAQHGNT